MTSRTTDWDAYYHRPPPGYTQFTRKLTSPKLLAVLRSVTGGKAAKVCELGGANSSFMYGVASALGVEHYHVVDANAYGLDLLRRRQISGFQLTTEHADVRRTNDSPVDYDLVYSVGLIEHFHCQGTADVIRSHFTRCKLNGAVLMTFPTPTIPYRAIQAVAEATGRWAFPDERPLLFAEVEANCRAHGLVIHKSINWWIGLTQGYLGVKKEKR